MIKITFRSILAGAVVLALIITVGSMLVAASDLSSTYFTNELKGEQAYTHYEIVYVRSNPSRLNDFNVEFYLTQGATVTLTGYMFKGIDSKGNNRLNNWFQIETIEGETAWINADALSHSIAVGDYDFQPARFDYTPYIFPILVELIVGIAIISTRKTSVFEN